MCSNHVHKRTRVARPRTKLAERIIELEPPPLDSVFSRSYDDYHNTSYFLRCVQILLRGPVSPADWFS